MAASSSSSNSSSSSSSSSSRRQLAAVVVAAHSYLVAATQAASSFYPCNFQLLGQLCLSCCCLLLQRFPCLRVSPRQRATRSGRLGAPGVTLWINRGNFTPRPPTVVATAAAAAPAVLLWNWTYIRELSPWTSRHDYEYSSRSNVVDPSRRLREVGAESAVASARRNNPTPLTCPRHPPVYTTFRAFVRSAISCQLRNITAGHVGYAVECSSENTGASGKSSTTL